MKKLTLLSIILITGYFTMGQISQWMYVTDRTDGLVKYVDMSNPSTVMEFMSGDLYKPYGIAIDVENEFVFVSDTDGFIFRYNLDGSDVTTIIDINTNPDLGAPYGLMIYNNKLYWGQEGGIGRCNFDGSNAEIWLELSLTSPPEMALCMAYNVDNNKFYFTNDKYDYSGGVWTINPDGTGLSEIVSGTDGGAIVVDAENDYIFYADWEKGICRNNFDGTDEYVIDANYIDAFVWGLAVDPGNNKVYYADKYDDKVVEANYDGTGITDYLTDINAHAMIIIETGTIGIDVQNSSYSIEIYPNPIHDYVSFSGLLNIDQIDFYNQMGTLIHTLPTNGKERMEMNLNDLSSGVYIVTFYSLSGDIETQKILKH